MYRADRKKLNTAAAWMLYHAERAPGRTALISERGLMTWGELAYKSGQFAAFLKGEGVARGDTVAYRLSGCEDFYMLFLACSILGCTAAGIGMQYTEHEAKNVLAASGAKMSFRGRLPEEAWGMRPYYGDGVDDPDSALFMLYTSGTTGSPKGIRLTERNVIKSALLQAEHFCNGCTEDDIFQLQVPVNHVSGAVEWGVTPIVAGTACVLNESFDPARILKNTEKYRVTMLCGVPAMWNMMLPKAGNYDLSSVRWCMSGASPVTQELIERIAEICPEISNPLGLTETAGFCTYSKVHASADELTQTVGMPVIPCRIVEGEDGVGPIAWKGDTVSPDAPRDSDGWFVSGDLGFLDEEGQLHLKGRSDDVFFTGGYTIYPEEVEQMIRAHPKVRECCVVPVPGKMLGNVGKAVIVPEKDCEINGNEIRRYLDKCLVSYKIPRRYEFRNSLPVNSMGKVIRKQLMTDS